MGSNFMVHACSTTMQLPYVHFGSPSIMYHAPIMAPICSNHFEFQGHPLSHSMVLVYFCATYSYLNQTNIPYSNFHHNQYSIFIFLVIRTKIDGLGKYPKYIHDKNKAMGGTEKGYNICMTTTLERETLFIDSKYKGHTNNKSWCNPEQGDSSSSSCLFVLQYWLQRSNTHMGV